LLEGLEAAGAYVHETILYELQIPDSAGESVRQAARGDLDALLFTSSLTVEHFLELARAQEMESAVRDGLEAAVVGAIGSPTAETAAAAGLTVDIVPESAEFEALARAVLGELTD
jgi:uroporphyrinogen-III synthase (EC 4.2.1.75)